MAVGGMIMGGNDGKGKRGWQIFSLCFAQKIDASAILVNDKLIDVVSSQKPARLVDHAHTHLPRHEMSRTFQHDLPPHPQVSSRCCA